MFIKPRIQSYYYNYYYYNTNITPPTTIIRCSLLCENHVTIFYHQSNTNTLISLHCKFKNRRVLFSHIITVMAPKRNTFIDGVDLSETTSQIHLLGTGDVDYGNEAQVFKQSAYYGENEFSKLLTKKLAIQFLALIFRV